MTWPVLLLHLTPHQLHQSSPCHDARRLFGSKKVAFMARSAALSSAMQLRSDDVDAAEGMDAVAGENKGRRRHSNAIFRVSGGGNLGSAILFFFFFCVNEWMQMHWYSLSVSVIPPRPMEVKKLIQNLVFFG
ncbi:hypothetical protein OsJ_17684 [Oryza sativa Japonica Group]|uniref:Uncharacterized protein n=1 Tax=Oryza sativa subsp. japonica TaxID=39947 RepID=B9FJA3_ORYSJ|nr:hypothetical protein OsJ_17684 [Oryza sativa Japonica Group]